MDYFQYTTCRMTEKYIPCVLDPRFSFPTVCKLRGNAEKKVLYVEKNGYPITEEIILENFSKKTERQLGLAIGKNIDMYYTTNQLRKCTLYQTRVPEE